MPERIHKRNVRGGALRGFTLVEMLLVAALVVIFSSIAVFSVSEFAIQNKKKASVGECRQIASAMSFAQQDLGFYPKICFLQFALPQMKAAPITDMPLCGFDYIGGQVIPNLVTRLDKYWGGGLGGKYIGFNEKTAVVPMTYIHHVHPGCDAGEKNLTFDWPADPFGQPYACYLLHAPPVTETNSNKQSERFCASVSEDANYFAGIVSYGPNQVPGLPIDANDTDIQNRIPFRLYHGGTLEGTPKRYTLPQPTELWDPGDEYYEKDANRQGRRDMILKDLKNNIYTGPRIRETKSDDSYFEF